MHRIWNIPEVVEMIVGALVPSGPVQSFYTTASEDSRYNLAVLARTARRFFIPASRLLWSKVEAYGFEDLVHSVVRVPGESLATSLDRYIFFEKFIKEINLSLIYPETLPEFALAYTFLTALRNRRTQPLVLPNLAVLNLDAVPLDDEDGKDLCPAHCTYAAYTIAIALLVPTLKELTIRTNLDELVKYRQEMAFLLHALPGRSPGLRKLGFFDPTRKKDRPPSSETYTAFLADLCRLVANMPALHTFTLPWASSQRLLKELSTRTFLFDLRLDAALYPSVEPNPSEVSAWPEAPFRSLRNLRITGHSLAAIRLLLPLPAQSPDAKPPLTSLQHVAIVLSCLENVDEQELSLSSITDRLSTNRGLRHLRIDLKGETTFSDEDILLLASTFRSLRHLSLRAYNVTIEKELSNLTMQSLVHLATHCPSLLFLRAHFLHLEDIAIPESLAPSNQRTKLELSSNSLISLEVIGNSVRRLWPAARIQLNGQPTIDHA